jgi:short-subunit dehydrogenase
MDLKLQGKTALITGASMGIGAHIAETLAAEGVNLHLTARSTDKLEELKVRIAEISDVSVTLHPLDLAVEGAAATLAVATSTVDILVNNARRRGERALILRSLDTSICAVFSMPR